MGIHIINQPLEGAGMILSFGWLKQLRLDHFILWAHHVWTGAQLDVCCSLGIWQCSNPSNIFAHMNSMVCGVGNILQTTYAHSGSLSSWNGPVLTPTCEFWTECIRVAYITYSPRTVDRQIWHHMGWLKQVETSWNHARMTSTTLATEFNSSVVGFVQQQYQLKRYEQRHGGLTRSPRDWFAHGNPSTACSSMTQRQSGWEQSP